MATSTNFIVVTAVFLYMSIVVAGQVTDVRLVGGSSIYEGTIEYSIDWGITWNTTCGIHLSFNDVVVICRQLGFGGANRHIVSSPYEGGAGMPNAHFMCNGDEESLIDCQIVSTCSSMITAGAAICYDESYLGCFNDEPNNRVLPGKYTMGNMTINKCTQYCNENDAANYVYAGVEHGTECYCGAAGTNYSRLGKVGNTLCLTECDGNMCSSCGGTGDIAVFNLSVATVPVSGCTLSTSPITTTSSTMTTNDMVSSISTSMTTGTETSADYDRTLPTGSGRLSTSIETSITETGKVTSTSTGISTQQETSTVTLQSRYMPTGSLLTQSSETSGISASSTHSSKETLTYSDGGLYAGVGGGVGSFLVLLLIVITIVLVFKRRQKQKWPDKGHPLQYMGPTGESGYQESNEEVETCPNNDADLSALYAVPEKSKSPVKASKEDLKSDDDFNGPVYATSMKHRPEPEGEEISQNDPGDLYAVPDKGRKSHVTMNGAAASIPERPCSPSDVAELYAVPDKRLKMGDKDEEEDGESMIDNYMYGSV